MKDFITYDIESKLDQDSIYEKATNCLPDFEWRKGDSDSQGKYISSINDNNVDIKLWLSAGLVEMSVSFSLSWVERKDRNINKQNVINIIETKLIPSIGSKVSKSEAN